MFSNARAVLFDLDGTLIDSAPDLGLAVDQLRINRGLPSLPSGLYRAVAGSGARGLLRVAFGITPEDQSYLQMCEEFYLEYEKRLTSSTYPFDGVIELISSLELHGLTWGVVTNKSMRFTDPITQQMPLFIGASVIVSGDTTPHSKPHPEPLLEAARRLDIAPEDCVYVGDDQRDIIAGLAANMGTVAATYGYLGEKNNVAAWGAHVSIDSPLDLWPLLNRA